MSKKPQNKRALSALKHGVTAGVLPHERKAWQRHLEAVRAELQPVGAVEEALVERVALALWRLRRVAAWEAGLLADARDHVHETYSFSRSLAPDNPPHHRQAAAVNVLRQTMRHWPIDPLAGPLEIVGEASGFILSERERIADLKRALAALDDPAQLATLDDDASGMAAIALIDGLDALEKAALAARWGIEPEKIGEIELTAEDFPILLELVGIERARAVLERELRATKQNVALVERRLRPTTRRPWSDRSGHGRTSMSWPSSSATRRISSGCSIARCSMLEALQARRRGEAAPLGRIEVYGLDESPLPARCDGAE
jgi:hypothetical protein